MADPDSAISGSVDFKFIFQADCGKASQDSRKPQITCSSRQETISVGTVQTDKEPKAGDKKGLCGFVKDTRKKLKRLIAGFTASREKISDEGGSKERIKNIDDMVSQLKMILNPPKKSYTSSNGDILLADKSFAEYAVKSSKDSPFKVSLKYFWDTSLVCK